MMLPGRQRGALTPGSSFLFLSVIPYYDPDCYWLRVFLA